LRINVCANLLSEWTNEQAKFREEAKKYGVGIFVCLTAALVLVPVIEHGTGKLAHSQTVEKGKLKELKGLLASANAASKAIAPKVETAQLRAQTNSYFERFMGETYAVLNAARTGVAFSSVKLEARSAEIVFDCRAEAQNYEAAAAFAEQSGRTPNKVSSLASTRPSSLLGPAGVSFEYLKRVAVK
jgi:hypothetical protein